LLCSSVNSNPISEYTQNTTFQCIFLCGWVCGMRERNKSENAMHRQCFFLLYTFYMFFVFLYWTIGLSFYRGNINASKIKYKDKEKWIRRFLKNSREKLKMTRDASKIYSRLSHSFFLGSTIVCVCWGHAQQSDTSLKLIKKNLRNKYCGTVVWVQKKIRLKPNFISIFLHSHRECLCETIFFAEMNYRNYHLQVLN
jgi:hypothetical protein